MRNEDEELRECLEDEECREWLNDDWWWRMERDLRSDWYGERGGMD